MYLITNLSRVNSYYSTDMDYINVTVSRQKLPIKYGKSAVQMPINKIGNNLVVHLNTYIAWGVDQCVL